MTFPAALQPQINQIIVNRGAFCGPLFDVSSATWVGDPTVAAISEKLSSTYASPYPIELLAFIERNPMYPEDVWIPEVTDYCQSLPSCQFEAIYVFDVATGKTPFEWPSVVT